MNHAEQIQGADGAVTPAPAGYVRQDALAELADVHAYCVAVVIYKKPAIGRVAIYLQPPGAAA